MIYDRVLENIDKGRIGGNEGLYMGFPKLKKFVPGVQPSTIYTIGAATGAGKTSFAMSSFVYNPFEDYLIKKSHGETINLKIFIYSMEMHPEIVLTKGICRRLFLKYGILTDINYVLSRGANRISQEVYDKVKECKEYFNEFEDVTTILNNDYPTGISKLLKGYYLNNGKEKKHPIEIFEDGEKKIIHVFDRYVPANENSYVITLFDHISLTKSQQGMDVKRTVDKLIADQVIFTNDYKQTTVNVQQLNRNVESVDRMKMNSIDAQLSDFKDTGDSVNASHYVFTLTNPFMYEFPEYRGYNIKRLRDRFRGLRILKSRDGISNVSLGLLYLGEAGLYKEANSAKDMTETDYKAVENIKKYNV